MVCWRANGKQDDYLTIKAAARFVGVCPNTLRNWESVGRIAVCRNPRNNYRLFKKADLEKARRQLERSAVLIRRIPR